MNESESIDKGLRELVHNIRAAHSNPKKLNALLDMYEKDFGTEANENVLEIIAEQTREAWAEIALEQERNDIDGILDTLWRSFESAGGEFAVERSEDSAQIHCTKCPVADTYLAIGKPEYGLIFHCSTDPHIVAGFNPEMEFRITKKLMNGDACCDHYYRLK